jgi:hypothetical protein
MIALFIKFIASFFRKVPAPVIPPAPQPIPEPTPQPVAQPKPQPTPAERLYNTAVACLGKDVTPDDRIDDDVDCADTVNTVYALCFAKKIVTPGDSTIELYSAMKNAPLRFKEIDHFVPGAIIISVTGTGNGSLEHGHTGICGKNWIMSNDSQTGKLLANFNYDTWHQRYVILGGFKTHCFLPL